MIYRFASLVLDDAARELRRDGERIETEPKAFDLLVHLIRHRDRAVSKDELLNELWPRQIVTETALTRCVMKARRAVGDESGSQSVIRTVHGHGYRFVAALEPEPVAATLPVTGESVSTRAAALPYRPAWLAGAAVGVMAILAILFFALREPVHARAGALAVLPVANETGEAALGWTELGLMGLMQRMLVESGIDSVPERTVLAAAESLAPGAPPNAEAFDELLRRTNADTVLHMALERSGGLYRLVAVLTGPDGRRTRRMIVGDSPAAIAADMASVVSRLLSGEPASRDERFRRVSTDPFVNELYARGLDLELQGRPAEAREFFRLAAAEEPDLFWLRYEIALCTRDLREWEEAERQFEALYEEALAGADAKALIVTLNSSGIMHLRRNAYPEARSLFERALEVASERGEPGDRATVLQNVALVDVRQGRLDDARRRYQAAIAAYADAGLDPEPTLLNNYAGLLMQNGDYAAAREYSEQAIEGFRLRGELRFEAPALNRLGKILKNLGDLDGATSRHEQALAIYRELGDTVGELSVLTALAGLYRARGDLTRAGLTARDVIERAAETDDELLLADARMQAAYVAADLGRPEDAIDAFEAARMIFERVGDDAGLRASNLGLALSLLDAGDAAAADTIARMLLSSAQASGHEAGAARARWLLGRIADARSDSGGAERYFTDALAYGRSAGDASVLATAALSLAELYLGQGDVEAAAALLAEVAGVSPQGHDHLRLEARVALARGETDRAAEILRDLRTRAGEAWNAEDESLLSATAN